MSISPLPSSSSPQINKTTNQSKYSLFYSTFGQNISVYQNSSIYTCLVTWILDLFRITSFITPYANNYGLQIRLNSTGPLLMNKFRIFIFSNNPMLEYLENFSSELLWVQSFQLIVTPWTTTSQIFLSSMNSWSLLKLMSIKLVIPSNHLILCRSLLLPPSIFPSIRVFSNESVLHIRWTNSKYWSFSFSISPSNEYSGVISFWMDGLDLLAVQGT